MPEGWYKNRASLVRNILAVGCKVTLEYLKRHEEVAMTDHFEKIDQLLKDMNRIAKYDRLDEFKRDIFTLQQNVLAGDQKNKAEIISLLDKLKDEVIKEQSSV
jgi:hypothetical protein